MYTSCTGCQESSFLIEIPSSPAISGRSSSSYKECHCIYPQHIILRLTAKVRWSNRTLEIYLRCMTSEIPSEWFRWLSLAKYWYNTSHHYGIKITPYHALHEVSPLVHIPYIHRDSKVDIVDVFMRSREAAIEILKHHLVKAANRMKQVVDGKRTEQQFKKGDLVLLKLQPHIQHSIQRNHSKLHKRYL